MPNHIHGILIINEKIIVDRWMPPVSGVETHNYASLQSTQQTIDSLLENFILLSNKSIDAELKNEYYQNLSVPAKSVSTIIRAFKLAVTSKSKLINQQFGRQSRFHDHIIRSQAEFSRIANNPMTRKEDRFRSS